MSVPGPVPGAVRRERLTRVLAGAGRAPVVVVSAPAGWGKTVALADWAGGRPGVHWAAAAAAPDRLHAALTAVLRHPGGPPPLVVVDDADRLASTMVTTILNFMAHSDGTVVLAGRGTGPGQPLP